MTDIVFNLFTSPKLLEPIIEKIIEQSVVGAISDMTHLPRGTVDSILKRDDYQTLQFHLERSIVDEEYQALIKTMSQRDIPLSGLAGFLVSVLSDQGVSSVGLTLSQLSKFEDAELYYREKLDGMPVEETLRAITSPIQNRVPYPENFPLAENEKLSWVRDNHRQLSKDTFMIQMVTMDIDCYQMVFPSYKPAMIWPLVMPNIRSRADKDVIDMPDKLLLNFIYCVVMEVEQPPTERELLSVTVPTGRYDYYQGKIKRNGLLFSDFIELSSLWRRSKKGGELTSEEKTNKESDFAILIYVAARIFSFVFRDARAYEGFRSNYEEFSDLYYSVWRDEVTRRGLSLTEGKDWDDSVLARLVAASVRWKPKQSPSA